jgi:tetratricopeptide (TPR) repeat protein
MFNMRKSILKTFLGVAAAAALAGCEESEPPKTDPRTVTAPVVQKVETPPPVARIETPPPEKVEATKVEPVEAVTDDEGKLGPDDMIKAARIAIDGNQVTRGYELARMCTLKAPKRASSWNLLGRAQLKRGERKSAIESFEKAVELNPKSSWAQNNLGLALIYDGRFEDAVDVLEEATQLEPVESYMWNNLGMAYEHLDRLDDARDAYSKAIELKSGHGKNNFARIEKVKTIKTAKAETRGVEVPETETLPDAGQ